MIADADLVVGQAFDGEVLAELTIGEVGSAKLALPIAVGFDLVDEDGAVLAAMPRQIALAVAVDVEPPDHPPALHRFFPDAGVDRLALPHDVARQPDIQG